MGEASVEDASKSEDEGDYGSSASHHLIHLHLSSVFFSLLLFSQNTNQAYIDMRFTTGAPPPPMTNFLIWRITRPKLIGKKEDYDSNWLNIWLIGKKKEYNINWVEYF
ncbi:hypothetical protein C5167_012381 [Papaver somniferum]|uniref:Uncharacterized protein n=1 Tax=Papaver somniferum TaxID=3469 RepID=A0A4Y7J182_PAPSO|nr:hypothetical protein C5167_012381 [Papaver somniferum]